MVGDDKLGELIGVPHAIGVLGHRVALPALASGALPVVVGNSARRVRRSDVDRLRGASSHPAGRAPALATVDLRSAR